MQNVNLPGCNGKKKMALGSDFLFRRRILMEKLSLYNGPAGALPMHKGEEIPGVFSHQSWRFVG